MTSTTSPRIRAIARLLIILMVFQTVGCAGRSSVPILPSARRVNMISPWRYYDLWQALGAGRGVLVGTNDGRNLSGKFVSGGARTIKLQTRTGYTSVQVSNVRYIVNVIDLSHARDGAIVGGVIGLGTGFALSYMTNGNSSNSASKLSRTTESDDSSTGESAASGTTTEGSNTEGGSSTGADAYDTGQGASSESSTGGDDPTATGSNVYDENGNTGSSGGSSAGGGTTTTDPTSSESSSESSGNSVVYINFYADGEGGSSNGSNTPQQNEQPSGGGDQSSPAVRAFFYTVTFAAIGAFVGWLIGRTMKKRIPRVDYILFPANLADQGGRSPEQYLADQVALPDSSLSVAETLLPGSGFDSPRSAVQFDQFAHSGRVVRLHNYVGSVISREDARAYGLFPKVDNFESAVVVRLDRIEERAGIENRYLAVVTYTDGGRPMVTLQRMSARDVVTVSTQIGLIGSGLL